MGWTRSDRRTLLGIIGFLAGLVLAGPPGAVAGACAGSLIGHAFGE